MSNDSQATTPLLDALQTCAGKPHASFYAPGHKRGQGTPQRLIDLLGLPVFQADLPELPELDNLFAPEGAIAEAQQLAAAAFGASQTWFLVNGSTAGIIAAILATCGAGDKIILPRNAHRSAISGLILSGAIPIFVNPEYDPAWDLAHSITPAAVADALAAHPDAKAVMMLYPTYQGVCGDLPAIAELAHQHNIPLLVDESHGPHFAFHPDLPSSALSAGADLTVQSIHKVLAAMTQASMLHVQGNRIDRHRLTQALQLVQSTSPSYLLLASLDAARQQMATQGKHLLTKTLQLANQARTQIAQISGLSVLEAPAANQAGFIALDPTRLTVSVAGLGITGYQADEILHQQLGVTAELPSLRQLTFIISLGNTAADIERLVQAFTTLPDYAVENKATVAPFPSLPLSPAFALSPRDAFFAATETLPVEQTCTRISAESICPYPPGIPVLIAGEIITATALDYLQQVQRNGGTITGCSDPNLKTLKVVRE
ncbi:MAG: aminotransferase class I/II-fold pyridoxal phosphate-dependent enzyme [Microcoleus vaginatus WJT46-NPBG5]|jgi:arginine/lysine/ornithine decarboxylase|nr:aminotransferase class I/II-fold pyridoxal phosphate-dependent enzyme [Microcoleus vaginatus WJT46-NPBG5]